MVPVLLRTTLSQHQRAALAGHLVWLSAVSVARNRKWCPAAGGLALEAVSGRCPGALPETSLRIRWFKPATGNL